MFEKLVSRRKFLIGSITSLLSIFLTACGLKQKLGQSPSATVEIITPTDKPVVNVSDPSLIADMVINNGKVITIDTIDTVAQAVSILDGYIQQVGSSEELQSRIGESTQVIDLAGRSLTPGFVDAHNHLQIMGLMSSHFISFNPPEVKTMQDLQERLASIIADTPQDEWIQGYYWSVTEGRLPSRYDLDPVSPDNPVWMMQMGGHYGSANSRALELAGIGQGIKSPQGGYIEVDSNGEPTGVFYNHRAMDMLRRVAPRPTIEEARQNIINTQLMFASVGVTSFQDNNVRGVDTINTYFDCGKQNEMYLRGAVFYTLEWPQDLDRALNEIDFYKDDFMCFSGYKFLLDGQSQMAFCHEPHNGVRWDMPTWDPDGFKKAVRALHDTGLQICVHCVGDAAVDLTLDAYEEAMNAYPRNDPRHRIEHAILTKPGATNRMKDLGVIISTQPQFIRLGGDHWPSLFGDDRMKRIVVTREWIDAGVHVALGSDAPTTPWYQPQITLAGAVSRITLSNKVFEPDQCMTLEEAFRAHTMESAYAHFEEDIKGSIEPGKLADMVIWTKDPYSTKISDIIGHPVDMTIVGGKIVYQG